MNEKLEVISDLLNRIYEREKCPVNIIALEIVLKLLEGIK
jgi:hypothetical protein